MSNSVAPSAVQDDNQDNGQQDSTERVKVASDEGASTHPEEEDDDWLDGIDTLPAPRGSTHPTKPASSPPQQARVSEAPRLRRSKAPKVASEPPAEAIVPARIVEVAPAERLEPELPAQEGASVENDAPSSSAHVLPIDTERRRQRRKKKTRAVAKPERREPVPARDPKPDEGTSWGSWLLVVAVAGVAGLWFLSSAGAEKAPPAEAQAAPLEPPPVEAPKLEEPKLEEPKAAAPSEPAPAPEAVAKAPAPAPEIPQPQLAADDGSEPARLTAYKAVVEATKAARGCRHHGDAAGKIPVVVEFGEAGSVQRTNVKATLANPMTTQCIASKFAGLTIPSFSGAPIVTTADVSLR